MSYTLSEDKLKELVTATLKEAVFAPYFEKHGFTLQYVRDQMVHLLSGKARDLLGSLDSKRLLELEDRQERLADLDSILYSNKWPGELRPRLTP